MDNGKACSGKLELNTFHRELSSEDVAELLQLSGANRLERTRASSSSALCGTLCPELWGQQQLALILTNGGRPKSLCVESSSISLVPSASKENLPSRLRSLRHLAAEQGRGAVVLLHPARMAPKRQRGRLNRLQQKGMLAQGEAAGDPSSSLSPPNPRFGMKYKRGDGCTGENDKHKKQKAHTTVHGDLIDVFEEQFGDLYDSGQGVWSEFSKGVASMLSESVLAVASFKGDKMVCSCSGIIILCKPLVTTLLTSASLVRSSHDESQIDHDLMVKVRNVHDQYWLGTVEHYDLDYDILLVDIQTPYLCVARLYHEVQLGPGSKVVAVGRVFNTKKLMAASGLVKDKRDISDQEECTISTCKISKVGIGGPLIDLDGNFHGMNFYGEGETPFLPTNIILECLKRFGLSRVGNRQGDYCTSGDGNVKDYRTDFVFPQDLLDMIHEDVRSCSYPLPARMCVGLHLVNSFEEGFRPLDPCGEDFMNELNVELASKLSQSVVSLAAFNGKIRRFACSGILVKYGQCTSVLTSASLVRYSDVESKINDDLQIEVCLPNGQCVKGVLQCCCLEYNIAVIKITEFTDLCAIQLERRRQFKSGSKVVAIGRIFAEGRLTATHGMITDRQSKLDCEVLMVSTCKITKAGIGGPLVDFSGNFVGMNFYDDDETPFLPRNEIIMSLRRFRTKGTKAVGYIDESRPNRWPVPEPYWSYTSDVKRLSLEEVMSRIPKFDWRSTF